METKEQAEWDAWYRADQAAAAEKGRAWNLIVGRQLRERRGSPTPSPTCWSGRKASRRTDEGQEASTYLRSHHSVIAAMA
jgi:hypothetical protein